MTSRSTAGPDQQVEAVMEASRSLVAIVARSFAEADVSISLPQWRVLVIVHRYGPLNLGSIAEWMGVHASNATRACDGLVRAGLLQRETDPEDRRRQVHTLSEQGVHLVEHLLDRRREAISGVLEGMPAAERDRVAAAMQRFADAAGDSPDPVGPTAGWGR